MKTNRILALAVALVMVAAAVILGLSGRPVSRDGSLYLTDKAGVISQSDAQAFLARQQTASPRLSVAVVKSTGKVSIDDYCVSLWDEWKLGTSDMLLLLVTGDQDYYFGYDWSASFAGTLDQSYQALLDRYLEPDFAAGDYGRAILTFSDGVQSALSGVTADQTGNIAWMAAQSEYAHGGSGRISLLLVAIIVVILLLAVASAGSIGRRSRRRRGMPMMPPPAPRRRSRPVMPPPPPRAPGPPPRAPGRTPSRPMSPPSRPSSGMRTSRPGGFSGGGRASGGFTGGGRSSGGMRGGGRPGGGMGGGGRSGGGMRGGRR